MRFRMCFTMFILLLISSTLTNANVLPIWAKSITAGSSSTVFYSVIVDCNNNVYAAGYISGKGSYNFGNKVIITGTFDGPNAILVKYDKYGIAQWTRNAIVGSHDSSFKSLSVDLSGNIYVAGYINDVDEYNFGNGIKISGANSGYNPVLVKYDSSGNALWAKSIGSGRNSQFNSVMADSYGNTYAVGYISGTGSYDFGNAATITGAYSGTNAVLVKYNTNGNTQWVKSLISASNTSLFNSVVVDSGGNVYVGGYITGVGVYSFANGITSAGTSTGLNSVLVKYNSANGNAQWAKSVKAGVGDSIFYSLAIGADGIYAAGYIAGTNNYNFGDSVTVAGSSSSNNAVLVKYNSSGEAQWVKSVTEGFGESIFKSVAANSSGNIYAVGYIAGTNTYGFDNGITINGTSTTYNSVLVKYDYNGNTQCAKSVISGSGTTLFNSIAIDLSRNAYVAGSASNTGLYNFGNSVTCTGKYYGANVALLKYEDQIPIATNISISVEVNSSTTFTIANFTDHFEGYDNSSLTKVKIINLPNFGILKLLGNNVVINQEINIEDLDNLVYYPDKDWQGIDSFNWSGSDGTTYSTNPAEVIITTPTQASSADTLNNAGVITGIIFGAVGATATVISGAVWCYNKYHKPNKVAPAKIRLKK